MVAAMLHRLLSVLLLMFGLAPAKGAAPPAVPALPDAARLTSYQINNSTCTCAVNFALYGDGTDYQNWVEVWINGILVANPGGGAWTITSPTGPLASIPRPVTDAILTFTQPQTGTVEIVGARRPRRVSQFQENAGVAARDLNQALTDIVAQNRETWDKVNDVSGRALVGQPGQSYSNMPLPAACKSGLLGFDSSGLVPQCFPLNYTPTVGTSGIFPVVCGGVDDTAALQAAVSAASVSGGTVLLPIGICMWMSGTLAITSSAVSISGAGPTARAAGSQLVFNNGSSDDIDIGFQSSQTNGNTIQNVYINNIGKTGGAVIAAKFTGHTRLLNLWIDNAFNGISFERTNTAEMIFDTVNIASAAANQYALKYYAVPDGTQRSDTLSISTTILQLNDAAGDGFLWDGEANNVLVHDLLILHAGGVGLHVLNTAASGSQIPHQGFFDDLQIDGEHDEAVKIEGGQYFSFHHGNINSILDTDSTHAVFDVTGDISHSVTRGIIVNGMSIQDGPGTLARITAQQSIITGSHLYDGGHAATNTVPALDIGANTNDLIVGDNIIGFVFGQGFTNNYSVQIESGAKNIALGVNDYRLGAGATGTLNDLGSANLTVAAGSIGYDGNIFNPTFQGTGDIWLKPPSTGNVVIGTQSALGTGAVNGFVHLPGINGAPLGVPTGLGNVAPPCAIDTINSKLWCYVGGAWKYSTLN